MQEAENMLRAMTETTNTVAPFFITSFCIHEPDSGSFQHGLLSQWRGYARGGFAIEFDEQLVDKLNIEESRKYRYEGLITEQVTYRNYAERVKADLFAGFAGTLLKNLFPNMADKVSEVLGPKNTDDFARPFLSLAPFLKDLTFEEENEYRIVGLCNRPSVAAPDDKRTVKPIRLRSRSSGQIVPYVALYEGLETKLPIRSIVIGPHPQQRNQRMALEILLEKCGLEVPIRESGIPFRD